MTTKHQPVLLKLKALLRKGFETETTVYCTQQPMEDLKTDIQRTIDASSHFSLYPRLTGKFLSGNEFEMTSGLGLAPLTNRPEEFSRQSTFAYGRLEKDEQGRTMVSLTVRSSATTPGTLLLAPVIWLGGMLFISLTVWKISISTALGITFAGLPLFLLLTGVATAYSKRRLRERVVRTYNLQQAYRPQAE